MEFASLAVVAVTVLCAFGALRWQARAAVRERQSLLATIDMQNDRLCHLVSRPWNLPPRTFDPPAETKTQPEVESSDWLPV